MASCRKSYILPRQQKEVVPAVGSTYNRELFKNGATEKRANQREYDIETSDSMATW